MANVGRPLKYTPEDFKKKVEEYFQWCDGQRQILTDDKGKIKVIEKPYTISGICVYLDISRDTWNEYKNREEFADTIKKATAKVENYVEEGVLTGKINAIGGIFNLKNNFGWVDKQEIDMGISQKPVDLTGLSEEELKRLANMQMQALPEGIEEAE